MNHLKSGEVKCVPSWPHCCSQEALANLSQPRNLHVSLPLLPLLHLSSPPISMAITFRDGVILGADSRTTTGAYIANRVTDKLTQVHDTIWCCRSGSAADTQAVADIVTYHLGLHGVQHGDESGIGGPTTETAAALFQELCYANKDSLRYDYLVYRWATDERANIGEDLQL